MAIIGTSTFGQFFDRVKKFLQNNWSDVKFDLTDNDIGMYTYECIGAVIAQMSERAFQEVGIRSVPEGFITTYKFTGADMSQDKDTGYYSLTLPSPPVGLPLGISLQSITFAKQGQVSFPVIWVNPYQKGFYDRIATPNFGVYGWVEGSTLFLNTQAFDLIGADLSIRVPMLSTRTATGSADDIMNVPDDALSMIFDMVVQKLTAKESKPRDNVNDGSPHITEQP